jgi:hypothetical protein
MEITGAWEFLRSYVSAGRKRSHKRPILGIVASLKYRLPTNLLAISRHGYGEIDAG